MNELDFISNARVNGIMQGLQDPRLLPGKLIWNQRIPDVPAVDDEIYAYAQNFPLVADIVADDAKAPVYTAGRFSFESTKIPNLKVGMGMNQQMLNMLRRLRANGVLSKGEVDVLTGWQNKEVLNVLYGVSLRKEILKCAMLLDGLNYDRLGIKLTGVTWGMPSDLKVTVGTAWTSTSATPITDINTVRRIARVRYGVELNRVTISTAALQFAVATTEFQNQVKALWFGASAVPPPAIPIQSDDTLRRLLGRILQGTEGAGLEIEIDDRRYWMQDTGGANLSQPILPLNNVLITSSANDGNSNVYDFANADVTEGIVANLGAANVVGGAIPDGPGPTAYMTASDAQLNPAGLVTWGVARGFPRKYSKPASAVLNVGTIGDVIALGVPFPV